MAVRNLNNISVEEDSFNRDNCLDDQVFYLLENYFVVKILCFQICLKGCEGPFATRFFIFNIIIILYESLRTLIDTIVSQMNESISVRRIMREEVYLFV